MAQKRIPVLETFSWQMPVISILDGDPPVSPSEGDRYIIGVGTGVWAGKNNQIAWRSATEWKYDTPFKGWRVHVTTADSETGQSHDYRFNGTAWELLTNKTETVRDAASASHKLHPTEKAIALKIEALLGATDAMIFIGTVGATGLITSPKYPDANGKYIGTTVSGTQLTGYSAGWTFKVTDTIPIATSGFAIDLEAGDMIIAINDEDGGFNIADFTVVQANIDGAALAEHITNDSIHFTQTEIDHKNLLNINDYTHQGIDSHIREASIHRQETYAPLLKCIVWNEDSILPSEDGDTNEIEEP